MLITMSEKDIYRFKVLSDVREKRLRQVDAAVILNVSARHIRRLLNRFSTLGAQSLAHAARGRPSNRRYSEDFKAEILKIIHNYYSDFSPTLALEKLSEQHNLVVSKETLRQWMIAGCLLVFIDDATGRLMNLQFSETESAFDYMLATRKYLNEHGKPIAFYSDKHSIFRVNQEKHKQVGQTQYGRVLKELGIELICANSSQAKGRVERANLTLQDRLVKEMRLQGINTIEEANAWLPYFIDDFNRRFAKPAKFPKNMHRKVRETPQELDDMFSWQEIRKLSKSLTFQYDKVVYLIEDNEENARLVHENVKVLDYPNGEVAIQYGHRKLNFKTFDKLDKVMQAQVVDNKRLGQVLKFAQQKQQEFEQQQKRTRSKKAPKRGAQQRAVQEQLRAINPVLITPETFKASDSKT